MPQQNWSAALWTMQVDGAALTNSTTATSLLAAPKYTLPTNFFSIGSALRIRGAGRISNIVTSAPTITLDIRFGSTVVFNGGAATCSTTAHTNVPIEFEILLTCRAIGASANLMGQGRAFSQALVVSGADGTNSHGMLLMPNTAPAVGNNFDSSQTQQVDCFGTWSAASASNSITLHQFVIESVY